MLIVVGGHAAAQATIAFRQAGFACSVVIVGQEADPLYKRPPLSKNICRATRVSSGG